jgi:hypothetical protein
VYENGATSRAHASYDLWSSPLAVLFFVGTLFVVGVGLLFYGLRGGSPSNFLTGVLMGMVILIVVGVAFTYAASKSLRYDPSTPISGRDRSSRSLTGPAPCLRSPGRTRAGNTAIVRP